ncbi:MAG: hypothetical protein QM767_24810 [Anaeromyxobacter sp.]
MDTSATWRIRITCDATPGWRCTVECSGHHTLAELRDVAFEAYNLRKGAPADFFLSGEKFESGHRAGRRWHAAGGAAAPGGPSLPPQPVRSPAEPRAGGGGGAAGARAGAPGGGGAGRRRRITARCPRSSR